MATAASIRSELEKLHRYRQLKAQQQMLQDELLHLRLRKEQEEAQCQVPEWCRQQQGSTTHGSRPRGDEAADNGPGSAIRPGMFQRPSSEVQQYMESWSQLLAGTASTGSDGPEPAKLRYQDIPWPPTKTGILAAYAAWLHHQGSGPAASNRAAAFQEAFKKASMHWHPDKFMAQLGPRLHEVDREAIFAGVHQVSQRINEERAARVQPHHS